jgi:hypothetical protein
MMTYHKTINTLHRFSIALFIAVTAFTGCKKDKTDTKDTAPANFIPQKNKTYTYNIENADGSTGKATVSITGTKDSSGITVYKQTTVVEASGQALVLNNNLFDLKGKTYTELKVPEAWYTTVAMFNALPNITVTKTEVFGYPAYLTMENALKDGSIIAATGALIQGQRIEFTNNGQPGSMQQEIVQLGGIAKVETVNVPAGSFTCNKFSYIVATKITNKAGQNQYTGNGSEEITVWMAHGIGMVKQQSTAELVTFVPLPTGEVKKVVTNTESVTTLQKIN